MTWFGASTCTNAGASRVPLPVKRRSQYTSRSNTPCSNQFHTAFRTTEPRRCKRHVAPSSPRAFHSDSGAANMAATSADSVGVRVAAVVVPPRTYTLLWEAEMWSWPGGCKTRNTTRHSIKLNNGAREMKRINTTATRTGQEDENSPMDKNRVTPATAAIIIISFRGGGICVMGEGGNGSGGVSRSSSGGFDGQCSGHCDWLVPA